MTINSGILNQRKRSDAGSKNSHFMESNIIKESENHKSGSYISNKWSSNVLQQCFIFAFHFEKFQERVMLMQCNETLEFHFIPLK